MRSARLHGEVDAAGLPIVGDLHGQGSNEPQERLDVWEKGCDARPAFDFSVESLDGVGGSEAAAMGNGDLEYSEALGEILSHPGRQPGLSGFVGGHRFVDEAVSVALRVRGEDATDAFSNFAPGRDPGHVLHRVALQVKLASLPRRSRESGVDRSLESGVAVTCDQLDTAEPTSLERLQKFTPMDFGFGGSDADTKDAALSVLADAHGDKDRRADYHTANSDLLVASIEDHVGAVTDGPIAPLSNLLVEQLGGATDLRGGNLHATELLGDLLDAPGRDAVDVHLSQGELQSALAPGPTFEGAGVEAFTVFACLSNLGDRKVERPDSGLEFLGLEAVGVPTPRARALVGRGAEVGGSLNLHGFVEEQFKGSAELGKSVLGQEFQDVVDGGTVGFVVGHSCSSDVVVNTTETTDGLPRNCLLVNRAPEPDSRATLRAKRHGSGQHRITEQLIHPLVIGVPGIQLPVPGV